MEVASRLAEPTAKGLAAAVSQAIGDGALVPGTKLTPIRRVATELGLSPTTVSAAWQLLARSGAIRTDGRRGSVVAPPRPVGPSRYRKALHQHAALPLDLATGVPDPLLLPDLGPALRRQLSPATSSYLDEPVLGELERVLRERWPAEVERIAVLDGAMDAIDHLVSALLRLGDVVVVEHPGFPPVLDLLDALGTTVVGVELDAEGPRPDSLAAALAQHPAAVILQPRAQNPTGASWSPARAQLLARALAEAGTPYVIEDDSAGDIATSPALSLASWLPAQTVRVASFAKSHGPDLRLAAVGGPAAILDPILERRLLGQGWTSRLLQQVLLHLLTDAASIAAVTRARREYSRRRRLVTAGLGRQGLAVVPGDGINLWLPVADEQAALLSLASAGIAAAAGTAFAAAAPLLPHLRLTVGLARSGHADLAGHLARAARAGGSRIRS